MNGASGEHGAESIHFKRHETFNNIVFWFPGERIELADFYPATPGLIQL
jgi:hypothetical protein